ncbi:hypothetical protein L917_12075 [Phytophthora nicotianae]|uniref:Uncharacterized protein n=1 Tax=Phytophthora nicotianae TaxID=4792 RepID=W2GH66_PHYNI|nr:hypothetical protein L915_12317 [Phytophthora nicotianae]ETL88900.1 hypothetical protein L917_12075 [Phytophthora nicotianae]
MSNNLFKIEEIYINQVGFDLPINRVLSKQIENRIEPIGFFRKHISIDRIQWDKNQSFPVLARLYLQLQRCLRQER